jgi:hypothetical protein
LSTAITATQAITIGTANIRIIRGMNGFPWCLAGGKASVGGS